MHAHHSVNSEFTCTHCRFPVSCDRFQSGVRNRNHCPYCLWSRHLDLNKPGDRLCACKAGMQPIGLTIKPSHNKYGSGQGGELMLIHICTACRKISINRIAADDNPLYLLEIFHSSRKVKASQKNRLSQAGIRLLGLADKKVVYTRLFGREGAQSAMVLCLEGGLV